MNNLKCTGLSRTRNLRYVLASARDQKNNKMWTKIKKAKIEKNRSEIKARK
jgi:hypothetical protein